MQNKLSDSLILGANLNCDPMSSLDDDEWGCTDDDCASGRWKDGSLACMCYSQRNDSWCVGTQSDFYDKYFEGNGKNPFGDNNLSNRKCNTNVSLYYFPCQWNWEFERRLTCCSDTKSCRYNDPLRPCSP